LLLEILVLVLREEALAVIAEVILLHLALLLLVVAVEEVTTLLQKMVVLAVEVLELAPLDKTVEQVLQGKETMVVLVKATLQTKVLVQAVAELVVWVSLGLLTVVHREQVGALIHPILLQAHL
jgi:hypothetical protein